MAKVKDAKDKITAYLKGKGLDPSEIKDAFAELDTADVDLVKLAESTTKNTQWETFWNSTAVPEFQKVTQERDLLAQKIEKLKAAGFSLADEQPAPEDKSTKNPNFITREELERFQFGIGKANSEVIKQTMRINAKHARYSDDEIDWDALEKLMEEKDGMGRPKFNNVEDAYRVWSKPVREKNRAEQTQKEVDRLVKERLTSELSKHGISLGKKDSLAEVEETLRQKAMEVKQGEKDKYPDERELKQAFLKDMDDTSGIN